jgi:hypothetical protein
VLEAAHLKVGNAEGLTADVVLTKGSRHLAGGEEKREMGEKEIEKGEKRRERPRRHRGS